ncbi:MAG: NAD(P)H-dependent oxidoreductase [Candidatus Woesearchaeota archaeon]|nr:MAG: NAD(P)H-dependent oxidoreductase [Candidatus Woesearchaeota archaeon]
MTKTLLLFASPNKEGHNATILSELTRTLDENKETYEVIDVFKEQVSPFGKSEKELAAFVQRMQKKITESERLIICTPVWWNALPSPLKAFFDLVFAAGFAFRYSKQGIPVKLLKGRTAHVITTCGAPLFLSRTLQGNRAAKVLCRDTLGFCGYKVKRYQFGAARIITEDAERVKKFARRTAKKILA